MVISNFNFWWIKLHIGHFNHIRTSITSEQHHSLFGKNILITYQSNFTILQKFPAVSNRSQTWGSPVFLKVLFLLYITKKIPCIMAYPLIKLKTLNLCLNFYYISSFSPKRIFNRKIWFQAYKSPQNICQLIISLPRFHF